MGDGASYWRLLRDYGDFEAGGEVRLACVTVSELNALRRTLELRKTPGRGTALERAVRIMDWLREVVPYDAAAPPPPQRTAEAVLRAAKENEQGAGAWMLSVALSELCLAANIPARYVRCFPYDSKDTLCHVVAEVHAPSYGGWVMLDPSQGVFATNDEGAPLSLRALRRRLAMGGGVRLSDESRAPVSDYLDFLARNVMHFECPLVMTCGTDDREDANYVSLAPAGFDAKAWRLENLDARHERIDATIKERPELRGRRSALKAAVDQERARSLGAVRYIHSAAAFWSKPEMIRREPAPAAVGEG